MMMLEAPQALGAELRRLLRSRNSNSASPS